MRRPSHYRAPLQRSPGSRSNGNAQSPTAVAPAASLAQQEAPSDAVTTEMSVGRLTSEVVVREYSEEENNSADEDNSPESDVPTAGDWRPLPTTEIPNLTQKLVLKRERHRHAQRSGRLMNWRVLLCSYNGDSSDKFVAKQLDIYIR
ncbi:hypothetical protein JG687_00013319 [Phytophthora cactorum]|uniref:Uncharacterized protein n=1 Tax=Phytophthora cactorum TaxID=29920 RepID=A0A8T1TZL6_9STRA|nr:hypothetical protein JG687_00013319 [Phytophthora cactorum]